MKQTPPSPHPVSRETAGRLALFADLVRRWTVRINLIAPGDLDRLWPRHIEDSLQLLPLVPTGTSRAIDLGSGGGFPGLVLAIATGLPFDLIEADQRKAVFLREAARQTGANVQVHAGRIERTRLTPAPLVTARALAPLDRLLDLATPLLADGGTCLFLKGAQADLELTQARRGWQMAADCVPSRTHPNSCIMSIRDPRRTPPTG